MTATATMTEAIPDPSIATDDQARFERDAIPYMRQMYPAAVRLTRDRCDAEDLIQETFVRAFLKFHQFTPGTNLRAWLYCIMTRTFYSTCRSRSRRPAEVLAPEPRESADTQAAAGRSAEAEALGQLGDSEVLQALADLPDRFKTAVYLADVEGYQYADIAVMMGTPLGTVMSRIHRGRRMLRAKLSPPVAAQRAELDPAPEPDLELAAGSGAVLPLAA